MREEQMYNPVNLFYHKIQIPSQTLCKIPNTQSLHKIIDTPMRDTLSSEGSSENEEMTFYPEFEYPQAEDMGISQESTSEDGHPQVSNINLIRKMSIRTSDIFSECKITDFKSFYDQYQTTKNNENKKFGFKNLKHARANFSMKKVKSEKVFMTKAQPQKHVFQKFEDDILN